MTLTVACVLKVNLTQDARFQAYLPKHARRLHEMVAKHLKQPFRFVCLTNIASVHLPFFDTQPIGHDWPGWWSKISLFQPGRFEGRVLYLDLDVTVVGSLDDLADFPESFIAIQDYAHPIRINSSVMVWDAGVADHVYLKFLEAVETFGASSPMEKMHGDQNWIHAHIHAARFPKRWCPSYKAHVLPAGEVPEDARVVVFHGLPKPWDLPVDHLENPVAA